MNADKNIIAEQLDQVRSLMLDCIRQSNLSKIIPTKNSFVGSGKMLRAQLTLTIGQATGVPQTNLIHAAAAVEIIHGASLLHDDVIDGGTLRRGAPTFWKKHGINGAILLGDLLVFQALHLLVEADSLTDLKELIDMTKKVCQSEVEQELILRGSPGTWAECEQIARRKTGSLFAFAAFAAGGENPALRQALKEAGFLIGTAYQLVDDILDASANESIAGKTLGKDSERGKTTAITATKNAPQNPAAHIELLCTKSSEQLIEWPTVKAEWDGFIGKIMQPVLKQHLCAGVQKTPKIEAKN